MKIMKKLFLVLSFLALTFGINASDYIPTKEDLARFPKTKTLVVLEDNQMSEFNLMLKQVMPVEWTITPFDFISIKDFEKKRMDPAFSFILLDQVKFEKDITDAKYNFISLLLGGSALTITSMPDLCSLPLSYAGIGDNDYGYKLGIIVRFMQNHVKLLMDNPGLAGENILKYYNKNTSQLGGKTLYLVAEEMDKEVNTLAKIKKFYSGPVKLATRDEIEKAIADKTDIVFLHKVGPNKTRYRVARCYKILIGAADAKFYYFDWHMIKDNDVADALLAKDFKKIGK
jgi:hypothetical protein